jgi:SSS family solute:Na+ symporter
LELNWIDIGIFVIFFLVVVGVSMYKSRHETTGEDFFLASRGLIWPMIGLSLIAANISTEHFVGMAGQGAGITGLAVASYEWMAAITLVFVAFFFLPRFLRSGIFSWELR